MKQYITDNKKIVIIAIALCTIFIASTVAASTIGIGAETPPSEEERGEVSRRGGMFLIWYGGGTGKGVRGVGGRPGAGGPGAGK